MFLGRSNDPQHNGLRRHGPIWLARGPISVWMTVLLGGCLVTAIGCSGTNASTSQVAGNRQDAPAPVVVAVAKETEVPVELHAIGRVEPKETVAVKSRVAGQIVGVGGADGQESTGSAGLEGRDVKKGDILFQIDPRPFEASLNHALANLARDETNWKNALRELKRAERLRQSNAITEETVEEIRTRADALASTIKADQAAIQQARLQLDYCTIRSPIDGRAGNLSVRYGNIVKADEASPLVVVNMLSPVYVSFTVPEQELPKVRRHHREAEVAGVRLRVLAGPPGEKPLEGELVFVDNNVDESTGTLRLKALFANEQRLLWPGLFVDVALRLTTIPKAVVVPDEAIQTGQQGRYVFVATSDGKAELRAVVPGIQHGGETVIQTGVKAGEQVVTDGQMRLAPGAAVEIKPPVGSQGQR